jgi:hypothetical protein
MKACLEKKIGKYLPSAKGGWRGYKLLYPEDLSNGKNEIIVNSGEINKLLEETE